MIPELEDAFHLDYETRSTVDLRKAGPWVYAEHWSTQVWTASFARGDDPVERWHPGDPIPKSVTRAAEDGVPWVAHNVGFERAITGALMAKRYGWPVLPIDRWYCTAAMAAAMSLPRKLEDAAKLLGCLHQKDMVGHKLMLKLMKPRKRIRCVACSGKGRRLGIECAICDGHGEHLIWWDDPADIERGSEYCDEDVETERDLAHKVKPLSPVEREVWMLDQTINERGVMIDLPMVDKALKIVHEAINQLNIETRLLTGGARDDKGEVVGGVLASQVQKLRLWLATEGLYVENLRKDTVRELLESKNLDDLVTQALKLREEAAKTSTAKLNAYKNRTCADSRMRDNLMYHGAGTGRWSGRGAQLQNLPSRYLLKKYQIDEALHWIGQDVDGDWLRMMIDTPLEVISACLRGMIIAPEGKIIYAGDYNAIEGRGTAWLANATNLLGVFHRNEDPYLYQAAATYGPDVVDISWVDWNDKDSVEAAKKRYSHERQFGKMQVLGLGYQMGADKFQATCAKERIIITDREAADGVRAYREANPEIPELWKAMDNAAFAAVDCPGKAVSVSNGLIKFLRDGNWLYMRLPSGRHLSYAYPRIEKREMPWRDTATGLPATGWGVTYMGMSSLTHKWSKQHGYGGKWTENGVQALCRDLLATAMLRLERAGYPLIVSVHDEAVSETDEGFGSVREYERIMCDSPTWAADMPVKAEGWRGKRYRK